MSSPGPHAFIMVLSVGSDFTDEEKQVIDNFKKQFGESIYSYFIVLFTRRDDLDRENQSLDEYIKSSPPRLVKFIEKCGARVVAFDNTLNGKASDDQVQDLLELICKNIQNNGDECYRDPIFMKAEKCIQEMENEKMSEMEEVEMRERDEERKQKIKLAKNANETNDTISLDQVLKNELEKVDVRAILGPGRSYSSFEKKKIRDNVRKDISNNGFCRLMQQCEI